MSAPTPLAVFIARGKARALIAEIEPEHLALLRKLMAENISLDRAVYEIAEAHQAAHAVATATLAAAEHLIQQDDAERLRAWLDRHSAHECAAILQHLKQRKVRPCQKKT
jgi:molybdopterin-guanine dinucleotide biosynthesis protein A